ncbi:hypothetical protein [Halococcus sp. IIIV-5B]|uniref:hypothetical protein n=1 Tax=Halococcus sp. IIIV-5B TaxID=2321230 RepID=UPI000E731E1A|nr:hypothetical protein [Halococcus sp. IIIV-5B]RJT07559.1 hypothetical protein D3261_02900 [Halococcus sp. IIIV-5B]
MVNWSYSARSEGVYMIVWGLALLAWILFAGSLAEAVMVGVLGFVFCWYGVGMIRRDSRALA